MTPKSDVPIIEQIQEIDIETIDLNSLNTEMRQLKSQINRLQTVYSALELLKKRVTQEAITTHD
jgi:uncharacterized protein YPO0396